MKITVGPWKMRNGDKAVIFCIDAPGKYPIKGYTVGCNGESCASGWAENGSHLIGGSSSILDLIEPWTEPKKTKKIRLAPALCFGSDSYFITDHMYENEEKAREKCGSFFRLWPASESMFVEIEVPDEA